MARSRNRIIVSVPDSLFGSNRSSRLRCAKRDVDRMSRASASWIILLFSIESRTTTNPSASRQFAADATATSIVSIAPTTGGSSRYGWQDRTPGRDRRARVAYRMCKSESGTQTRKRRSAETQPKTPPAATARTTCGSADGLAYQPRRNDSQPSGRGIPAARSCAADTTPPLAAISCSISPIAQ